jgi:hypothetical protein
MATRIWYGRRGDVQQGVAMGGLAVLHLAVESVW